jgi:E3 ubiquitin-protein ligase synoviolin
MPPLDLLRHRTHLVLRSALSHRVQLYSLLSLAAVSAAIFNALRNYSNFYSVTIYLSKSSRSVLVRVPTAPRGAL